MLSSRPIQIHTDAPVNTLPAKTPRRAPKHGRMENAGVPPTVNAKAKGVLVNTPYHAGPAQQGAKEYQKPLLATLSKPGGTRPLGDKTPFPNRTARRIQETPAPDSALKPGALDLAIDALLEEVDWDIGNRRLSSTRKRPRLPKSAEKHFQTPPNNQGSVWVPGKGQLLLQPELEEEDADAEVQDAGVESEEKEDYDEIEYMPPKLEVPYQPPFDFKMPDYKKVGSMLYEMAHSYYYDDTPLPPIEFSLEKEDTISWDDLHPCTHEDFLDDDPFEQVTTRKPHIPGAASKSRPTSTAPTTKTRTASGPTTTSTKPTTSNLTRRAPVDPVMATTPAPPRPRSTVPTASRQRTISTTATAAAASRAKPVPTTTATSSKTTTTTTTRPLSRAASSARTRPDVAAAGSSTTTTRVRSRPTTSASFYPSRAPSRAATKASTAATTTVTTAAAGKPNAGTRPAPPGSSSSSSSRQVGKNEEDEGIKFKGVVDLRDQIEDGDFIFQV
ncbi:hypothetical protein AX16_002988 [Volvariella volvacea WC 439]|nr:hypothetical protein AX16_002988 [Volvariella volvacea WC 439]